MKKLLMLMLFISLPAFAGGSHHNDDEDVTNNTVNQTYNTYPQHIHKHDDRARNALVALTAAWIGCNIAYRTVCNPFSWIAGKKEDVVDLKPKQDDDITVRGK